MAAAADSVIRLDGGATTQAEFDAITGAKALT
jgi:hypothetical protein